ncbi:AacA4 family aminoglycoside N(6')-acetyltransferase [Klebsiella pneumoniae]|nr:AacA4 family aminoglycoside N(6')-acetyltransferase [Klebsiella pneumoniae]
MSIQHFQTKLGITKYSIVTNSNDSVTLRLMTEHDLAMLYEWLNRSHIVEWWGGEEARPTLADVQEQYLPSVLAQESVTPYIAMLNGEPIGYAQSYVALGSGDGWWEEETDPGVRGIDQSLANASQLGKGLGTKLVRALVELLFNDPEVTKIQTDPYWRMHHNWAKAWEPSWSELWLSCCSMIPRSPRSKRTRRRATCERSDATRKRGLRGKVP